jgi:exodeoxyribonuclease V beta subunit
VVPPASQAPFYRPVTAVDEIDLDRHGFIEASAGTGKTYTIEHLVLRLLKEKADLQLEEILLVTYTEKAVGELKARIRKMIETALAENALSPGTLSEAQTAKFKAALDSFDLAAIHTIHGFCHGVLSDYAFENRMPFDTEVVADDPIYAEQLRELMRRDWPAAYGEDLQLLLQLAGFAGGEAAFSAQVIALASDLYRPQLGDRLLPAPSAGAIETLLTRARQAFKALSAALRPVDAFLAGYGRLNFNAAARRARLANILAPLAALADEAAAAADRAGTQTDTDLGAFADWFLKVQTAESQGQKGIDAIVPAKWNKQGPNLEVCPRLPDVMAQLTTLQEIFGELQYWLQVEAVAALQARVPRIKAQKGWISYNDMLTRVADALTGPGGRRLTAVLRRRYKVAFVDEFQDTDPVQWRIFAHLFLDDGPSAHRFPDDGPSAHQVPDDGPPWEMAGRLFLIGDPKQAIYAFRGADVFAYLSARQRMEQLAAKGDAGLYCLATNWRSSPGLVAAFNRLFDQDLWFAPPPGTDLAFAIGYQPVLAPPPGKLKLILKEDESGRGAVNVIDLSGEESLRRAKYRLADLIAAEIQHLVTGSRLMLGSSEAEPNQPRRLGYGDIGVLIRSRAEAILVERAFRDRQVPYAYYKKPGLFQSEDARHFSLILHAIAEPQSRGCLNAALLTPFFDFQPEQLGGAGGLPDPHRVRRQFQQWRELAQAGRWSQLFDDLFSESGALFRQAGTPQWDRFESNCLQLSQFLQQMAYTKNLDLRGLTALLDTLIEEIQPADPDSDLHQIDTEAPKVQLMTMHVSKGLQFPIVFVAGGLTQAVRTGPTVYHRQGTPTEADAIVKVIDLSGAEEAGKTAHLQEAAEEDKRLLYVALTRAQLKLYLPYFLPQRQARWVGPAGYILAPALAAGFDAQEAFQGLKWLSPAEIMAKHAPAAGEAGDAAPDRTVVETPIMAQPSFLERRTTVASFSRLHQHAQGSPTPPSASTRFAITGGRWEGEAGGAEDEADVEGPQPDRGTFQSGDAHETAAHPADRLPGGAAMGSLLHDILERIDYGAVRAASGPTALDADSQGLIRQLMRHYQLDPIWQAELAHLIWTALTTPIPCGGSALCLGDLPGEARLHETEFYCHLAGRTATAIPEGFLRGYVDLLFHHQGRYYILDWKSNRLADGYDPAAVATNMTASGYHLQYRIYTLATLRWLKRRLGRHFDVGRHFGGVYYIYLRGLNRCPGGGIFYAPPEEIGALANLEADLMRQLEACHGC